MKRKKKDQIYELNVTKMTIDGQPIETTDFIMLMTKYGIIHTDQRMEKLLTYFVRLYEDGHNGMYLKKHPEYTFDKKERLHANK